MIHVWNTITYSETNITLFQAEHGIATWSTPLSISEAPPKCGPPTSDADLESVAVSAKAFIATVNKVKAVGEGPDMYKAEP